ncbi:membrane protein [Pelistega indica]|uniref:Membrane protein n=1 Tax=Pelistega indica TaxID=1414851 RepID=V8G8V4_9BURK|nr:MULTISPECIES: tripartite tricarboxylate transporter TctB family protein [Pelistega]ETD72855.1 membrane protein [Pelistega indica]
MLIKNQQDFWSGLMFIGLGSAFALIAEQNYDMGSSVRMGPGYFPFLLGCLLAILGAFVTLSSLRGEYNEEHEVSHFDWDILLLVIGSIVLFGYTLNYLGMYISVAILVIFSSLASHEFSWKIAIANAIFLIFFAWLVFVKGLGLVFPTLPAPWSEWSTDAQIIIPIAIVVGCVIFYKKVKGAN